MLESAYRDVPSPILSSMIERNERDGFVATVYSQAMRAEQMRRVAILTIAAKVRCNERLTSRELDLLRGELRATRQGE